MYGVPGTRYDVMATGNSGHNSVAHDLPGN